MEKQILDLLINMDKKFTKIDERFDQMDKRFEQIDARLDQMDKRIDRAFTEIAEVKKTQIEMFAAMRGGFLEQDRKIEELMAQKSEFNFLLDKVNQIEKDVYVLKQRS